MPVSRGETQGTDKGIDCIMPEVVIRIEGLDRLQGKLAALEPRRYMTAVMGVCLSDIKRDVAAYPPATEANQPRSFTSGGRNTWYERGYGSRWVRKNGSIGGRHTSELLGRSWTTRVEQGGMRGVVGNKVSYGPFVQDEGEQAPFHKARGWTTIQQVAKRQAPRAIKRIQEAVRKILRG